ncbi:hypothetical protein GQ55_5G148100 [Panicum hallii var. hallii]|uniref:Uncharacterized protein n=1 Tax=Panicum hallii var. hallii TaxID=1504633 RepID=A0A2T7DGD8_9POAL|nr:hypothetical protein GQ55_5G148100 [Panicum hallii var. hallii]
MWPCPVRAAASFPRARDQSIAAFPRPVGYLAGCWLRAWSYGPGEAGGKAACVCLPTGTEKKFDVTLNSLKETKKPCSMAVFAFVLLRDDRFPWGFGVADGSNHVGSLNRLGEMLCFLSSFL